MYIPPVTTTLSAAAQILYPTVGRFVSSRLPTNEARCSLIFLLDEYRKSEGRDLHITRNQWVSAVKAAGFVIEGDAIRRRTRRAFAEAYSYGDPVNSTTRIKTQSWAERDHSTVKWLLEHLADGEWYVCADVLKACSLELRVHMTPVQFGKLLAKTPLLEVNRIGKQRIRCVRCIKNDQSSTDECSTSDAP